MTFPHEQVCRVAALRGDVAALGAAVTVALCGHWEHEPPCRWPHHTSTSPDADSTDADSTDGDSTDAGDPGSWLVTVRFVATGSDEEVVRHRIRDALAAGTLSGPDGTVSTWILTG